MPKKSSGQPGAHERYWEKRVRSVAFRRNLAAAVTHELRALGRERVEDVVDARLVRRLIQDSDVTLVDRKVAADLVLEISRHLAARGRRTESSLIGLLDEKLVDDVDALLDEEAELSPHAQELIARMMQQEFVRRLFTDIIFTSIVSFYRKVNPLFGALTTRMLEEQIKNFIRLFMPAIQRQAAAFAVSSTNQRIAFDFTRSILRQLLDEPLAHYSAMVTPGQRKKSEAILRRAIGDEKLDARLRDVAATTWDALYRKIRHRQVGEILRVEKHAGWIAERGVEILLPALARPGIVRLIAAEAALAPPRRPPG